MKLWNARSITHKTHFFSALCRSLYTNSCWIFATSIFIKEVGSKGYSQLFFFASLSSLIYYTYFAVRGHTGKEPYNAYKAVLVLALLASVGCFLVPYSTALKALNAPLLYAFVVSVMTVDLIGTTLGPMVLQASVNPAIFRRVFKTIISCELLARIAAAALVWILSQGHLLVYLYPFAWTMLTVHFILFGVTVARMSVLEFKPRTDNSKHPAVESLSDSVRFVFANPLVRVAMSTMAWATVTKFVLENLFYQVADAQFASARQIAAFVSAMTMTIYVLSLPVHHLISRTVNRRLQLSSLLSVQPINVLVLGGLALILPPFWPLVVLMVTYNIIHRSIQLPMSRQCMIPVPRKRRGTIVSLISIVVSLAALITSGGMAVLKNYLHLQDFLVILLLLGSTIFFVITSLDSYYIRNMWSFFKEGKSGSWQDEPQLDTLSTVALEPDSAVVDVAVTNLKSHPILNSYSFSSDRSELLSATNQHRQLLESSDPELLLSGLRICYVADFPWFSENLSQATAHDNPQVRHFAQMAVDINQAFTKMAGYSSVFRRNIKTVAMEVLEAPSEQKHMLELKNLLNFPDHKSAEALMNALADARFKELSSLLFSCVIESGTQLTVIPIVERMYAGEYENAKPYRQLLEQLAYGKSSPELRATIEANLSTLKRDELPLGRETTTEHTPQLQKFMHTLFLEEYRLSPGELDKALSDTIEEFQRLSPDESGILIDMHLSFLKRSELFNSWQALMA